MIKQLWHTISYSKRGILLFLCCLVSLQGSTVFGATQQDLNSIISSTPWYNPGVTSCILSGGDNLQQAYGYFVGKGLTSFQSAGIIGNFEQESGVNPTAQGGGIAQWIGGRATALKDFATQQNQPTTSLGLQLDFAWAELTGTAPDNDNQSGALSALKATANVTDATTSFMNNFEHPGVPQLQNRINYAQNILTQYGNTSLNSTSGCSVGSCTGSGAAVGSSQVRQDVVACAEQELSLWKSQPGYPKTSYAANGYFKYSQNNVQLWCADFVSWIYYQAGDPLQTPPDWRVAAVQSLQSIGEIGGKGVTGVNGSFSWHPESSNYVPQPGDIAIIGAAHTEIFISSSGGASDYIGGDEGSGIPGTSIVAEDHYPGYYGGGITGYVSPD